MKDFSTLQRLDRTMVTESFKEKESDMIYQVNFKGQPLFIFILTEFQSTVDHDMPLRFIRYIAVFYEILKRGDNKRDKFPPVLPILHYTGNREWTAPFSFQDMVKLSIPKKFIPHFEYYPVLVKEIPKKTLARIKNALSAVFYLENPKTIDPKQTSLTQDFNASPKPPIQRSPLINSIQHLYFAPNPSDSPFTLRRSPFRNHHSQLTK